MSDFEIAVLRLRVPGPRDGQTLAENVGARLAESWAGEWPTGSRTGGDLRVRLDLAAETADAELAQRIASALVQELRGRA